jgi:acyl-ACP thioesterase
MNNTHYPDMICDFLSEMTDDSPSYRIASLALSYIKESPLAATLTIYRSQPREDGTVEIRTINEDMQVCLEATVQFARADTL